MRQPRYRANSRDGAFVLCYINVFVYADVYRAYGAPCPPPNPYALGAVPQFYPYGPAYPPQGFSNSVQMGLVTEHMLRVCGMSAKGAIDRHTQRLDESRMLTMGELMRRQYGGGGYAAQPYVEEPTTPRYAIDAPGRSSRGHGNFYALFRCILFLFLFCAGDWQNQIEHICGHLFAVAQEDRHFRKSLGEPQLGEVSCALFLLVVLHKSSFTFSPK